MNKIKFIINRAKDKSRMGGLHQAFKDALDNLHLKSNLRHLFNLLDPVNSTAWPNGFIKWLNGKAEVNDNSASAKKFAKSDGFGADNVDQLAFADKIDERFNVSRKVINNFFNPNWISDYGSGGNEEGHLLLLRNHYYKNEFVIKNTRKNVNAFMTQIKKNPTRKSQIYQVSSTSTAAEIEEEISRIARLESQNFNPEWYPNQWLAFYLFGQPAHGNDHCFETLNSGRPLNQKESTADEMHSALHNLNTEAADKNIRRHVKGRKTAAVVDLSMEPT